MWSDPTVWCVPGQWKLHNANTKVTLGTSNAKQTHTQRLCHANTLISDILKWKIPPGRAHMYARAQTLATFSYRLRSYPSLLLSHSPGLCSHWALPIPDEQPFAVQLSINIATIITATGPHQRRHQSRLIGGGCGGGLSLGIKILFLMFSWTKKANTKDNCFHFDIRLIPQCYLKHVTSLKW